MLSVAIITLNEEKNIERCLKSILKIADEIIVLDSLSADKTREICEKYHATFISQPFLGYIEQKNKALDYCSNKYVLCLDADEELSENLIEQILSLKQKGFKHDAYTMKRCSNFCGKWIKHGTWYPDKKLRLFNKQKGVWGGTNPHDKIELKANATHHFINSDILHYSYYSIEEVITQNNKFTTIQAQAMYSQGKKSNWVKMFINPMIAFINGYIFKLGFLDGVDGYFIASSVSYQTMVKYAKLHRLQNENK